MAAAATGAAGGVSAGAGHAARGWPGRPWPLSRMVWAGVAGSVLVAVLSALIAGVAFQNLSASRRQVTEVADPAAIQAFQLDNSVINQETGVRGYALSATASFLQPYDSGLAQQRAAAAALHGLLSNVPGAQRDLAIVNRRIAAWQRRYATPTIAAVRAAGKPLISPAIDQGKADFDALRASIAALERDISRYRVQAIARLNDAATTLQTVIIVIGVALMLIIGAFAVAIQRAVVRPVSRLARNTRSAAESDFGHVVESGGSRELTALGADVERMRERIVAALTASREAEAGLLARTQELQRSNAELEQFAYVASHDLQEPLRKVASFCQMLQRRYSGQLDETADLYIEYAVDGAKRMQQLINDLLAFSRVGRIAGDQVAVSATEALDRAAGNLSVPIRQSKAKVTYSDLPTVRAEAALLTTVFQNLLGNALKFRSEDAPRVTVTVQRDGDFWCFYVTDNGIGVEPEYAERIFVIFQRLHDRQSYPGTGIGLALCRKIVEYHGGRMWLDAGHSPGARFCFTLPALPEDPAGPEPHEKDHDGG
jgi:signal transduction histidine kinase